MSDAPQIPVPDYDDPKEIYAFFGLAYYQGWPHETEIIVRLGPALSDGRGRVWRCAGRCPCL